MTSDEPPEPPSPPIASSVPSACSRCDDRGCAASHRLDRRTPVAGSGERLDVRADSRATSSRVTSAARERVADDACVDEHDVHPVLAESIGEVRVLLAFGIERSDEYDGWH